MIAHQPLSQESIQQGYASAEISGQQKEENTAENEVKQAQSQKTSVIETINLIKAAYAQKRDIKVRTVDLRPHQPQRNYDLVSEKLSPQAQEQAHNNLLALFAELDFSVE